LELNKAASVGWAKRSVPTADLQFALTLTWAQRCALLPTLRLRMMNGAQRQEALGHIAEHLSLIDKVIAKCEDEVRPIHASVKESGA